MTKSTCVNPSLLIWATTDSTQPQKKPEEKGKRTCQTTKDKGI